MGKTVWKDVSGFEGYYQVSNFGDVKRMKSNRRSKKGFILKHRLDNHGYVEYKLSKNNQYFFRKAHRLVAQAFIPNPDNLYTVNHKNGIKTDNRVENLEWMSLKDNALHSLYVLRNIDKIKEKRPGRAVICVETGEIFDSITNAAEHTTHHQGNISRALKTGGKAGGYHWKKYEKGRNFCFSLVK